MTYHFIGIGGIGMSALARVMLDQKMEVSGSDLRDSALVTALRKEGAAVDTAQAGEQLVAGATVIYSSAVQPDNVEFQKAKALGCRTVHRADLLCELMQGFEVLAVTGTHGKTTTSAMLAWVLMEAGLDPAFAIGGVLPGLERNGRHGTGKYFVAEADESDGTFTKYRPHAAIVTGVEADHLDHYGDEKAMWAAYEQFFAQSEKLFWCANDAWLSKRKPKGTSYNAKNIRAKGFSTTFDAVIEGEAFTDVTVQALGEHNALNGAGVLALALSLGVDEEAVRSGLASFPGVGRRCQVKGERGGVLVIDDYAHHPTEVATTLEGIRAAIGPRRLIAVFQPHRYSRLQKCLDQFVFDAADEMYITDVYSAGEAPIEGVDAQALLARHPPARYAPDRSAIEVRPTDVVVMMGAGDITRWATPFEPAPLRVALLCGGKSLESEVSKMSADFFEKNLRAELYSVERYDVSEWPLQAIQKADVVIPCLHGPHGEDGTAAGLLEALEVPYVGCGIAAGAVAMDKALTKYVAQGLGIPTAPFIDLRRKYWDGSVEVEAYPVFVKAAHQGSTFGVIRVDRAEDLLAAIEEVFAIDDRLIIEPMIRGRQVEVALLETTELFAAPPFEILAGDNVHTFEGKYTATGNPVDFSPDLPCAAELQQLSKQLFSALACRGLCRIDWFVDEQGNPILNEINPFPGCTPFSPYPQALARVGIPHAELVDHLIIHALRYAQT